MSSPGIAASNTARISRASVQSWLASQTYSTTFAFIALFAAALSPVLWFGIPMAMADYPNHLARMFILSRSGGPHPNPFYEVTWALYPNLAMDLLVPPFGRLIGVETATRLFYLAGQILIVTGAMAIERVVKGRLAIAGFVALMFLYSLPFAWGFVNFEFALGCALWGIAAAFALQERNWIVRLALHSVVIAWLFVAHLFALGIYGFTIGVHELWRARTLRSPLRETLGRLALMALPTFVLIGIMVRSGGAVGGHGTRWFFAFKPLWPFRILSGYSSIVSVASAVVLILLMHALGRRGALRFKSSGAWLAAGFALLFLAIPSRPFDTAFADLRVIVAAGLVMPAFISMSLPNAAWRRLALAVAAAITVINVGVVLGVWISYRGDYAAAAESFRHLPKRSMVLVGYSGNGDPTRDLTAPPIDYVPTLAVQYADAFVSDLFMEPGKQPVVPAAPWRRFSVANVGPVPMPVLKAIAEHGASEDTLSFIRTWPRDFDYLYLVGPPIANPMPALLEEVSTARRFVLYRIRKPAASAQ
ncbi:MAG TPA: hypothetical protein VFX37_05035 [Pseudolabrys sp.]|nr:hypothetical protein [Pseudolabrys sp.]